MIRPFIGLITIFLTVISPAQARDKFLDIQSVTSPGGITAWLVEDHSLPVIALSVGFMGAGAINDPADKQGLTRILSNTLDEGAGPYDSAAFQAELENNSISLSFSADRDHFIGTLKALKSDQAKALELLRLSLTEPRFDPEALQRMVDTNLMRIRSSMTDPEWMNARLMNDRAYAGHPYAMNIGGTLSSLPKITSDDLRTLKNSIFARDNIRIGITGDITAKELAPLLDQVFGGLPATAKLVSAPDLKLQNTGKTFVYQNDIPQTIIGILQPSIKRNDPDYEAAVVVNQILGGGGFGSRLMDVIREKGGLTYGIYSGLTELDHIAVLGVNTSTRNETLTKMLQMIHNEFVRAKAKGMTAAELNAARGYLLGSMPTSLTSTDRIAGILLSQQLNQRPIDDLDGYRARLAKVTLADVNRVAARLLDPEKFITILVGKPPEPIKGAIPMTTLPNVE